MRNVFICKPVEYDKSDCILQMISCMPSTWWINFCLLAPLWHTPLSQLLFRSVVGPSNLYEMVTYLYRYIKCIHAIYIYIYIMYFLFWTYFFIHRLTTWFSYVRQDSPTAIPRASSEALHNTSWNSLGHQTLHQTKQLPKKMATLPETNIAP